MRRLFALLPLCLVGCARDDGRTVLRVANWGGAGDDGPYARLVQEFYREFERENPGVRVQIEGLPGRYVERTLLNFVAGTAPDVVTLDASSAAVFVDNGFLQDLRPFMARDPGFRLSDYFPNAVDVARRGERIYAVPGDFTPMVVYYNQDLFDQAGVRYPDGTWDFAEFRETCRKLTRKGRYGFVLSTWMPGWVMWLWNNGGEVLSPDGARARGFFDSPQNAQTLGYLRSLVDDGSAPTLGQVASLGVDPFASGQAAMTVSGHWSLPGYKAAPKAPDGKPLIRWERLGVCALPTNVGRSHTVLYEAGFAIPVGAKHPELAWKFLRQWTGYRLQRRYNESGIAVSARRDVARERATDPIERQFLALIPLARPPLGSRVAGYGAVERHGTDAMSAVLQNGADPRDALARAAERIDREFAKSR